MLSRGRQLYCQYRSRWRFCVRAPPLGVHACNFAALRDLSITVSALIEFLGVIVVAYHRVGPLAALLLSANECILTCYDGRD